MPEYFHSSAQNYRPAVNDIVWRFPEYFPVFEKSGYECMVLNFNFWLGVVIAIKSEIRTIVKVIVSNFQITRYLP